MDAMKKKRRHYSLGDLILAVSSYTKNNRETLAKVAELLERGHGRKPRRKS